MFCVNSISKEMARVTGLEPATSGVTGRHSNQLSYTRAFLCFCLSREGDLYVTFCGVKRLLP
jgi:hypothetical protein